MKIKKNSPKKKSLRIGTESLPSSLHLPLPLYFVTFYPCFLVEYLVKTRFLNVFYIYINYIQKIIITINIEIKIRIRITIKKGNKIKSKKKKNNQDNRAITEQSLRIPLNPQNLQERDKSRRDKLREGQVSVPLRFLGVWLG